MNNTFSTGKITVNDGWVLVLDTKGVNVCCAAGIINGILNNTEPSCGCSGSNSNCC